MGVRRFGHRVTTTYHVLQHIHLNPGIRHQQLSAPQILQTPMQQQVAEPLRLVRRPQHGVGHALHRTVAKYPPVLNRERPPVSHAAATVCTEPRRLPIPPDHVRLERATEDLVLHAYDPLDNGQLLLEEVQPLLDPAIGRLGADLRVLDGNNNLSSANSQAPRGLPPPNSPSNSHNPNTSPRHPATPP